MNHDALVDAVAREMTDRDPSRDFRARVVSRLTAAPRARYSRTWAAASIAATLIVALWLRPASDPVLPAPALPPFEAGSAGLTALPSGESAAAPLGQVRRATHTTAVSADELAWLARAVPPLPRAEWLTIEPIQPAPPSIAPITVDTLVTDPISIPPMETRSGARD